MRFFLKWRAAAVAATAAILLCGGCLILAWNNPGTDPPGNNAPAPINVSSNSQSKAGNLNIGTGLDYWITKSGDSFALKNSAGAIQLVVGQDGHVGIGTAGPDAALDVNGQIKIRGGSPSLGKVLTSDANGLASWQAAPGGVTPSACTVGTVVTGINASGSLTCGTQVTPATCPAGQFLQGIGTNGNMICDDLK